MPAATLIIEIAVGLGALVLGGWLAMQLRQRRLASPDAA